MLLDAFPFADIDNGRQDSHPIRCRDRTQADLQRKFSAVLAYTIEIPSSSHGTRLGMGKKFDPIAGVMWPHMLRHKYLNRLPNQFSPFIAEQLIYLPIDHPDNPLLINHQQSVRG